MGTSTIIAIEWSFVVFGAFGVMGSLVGSDFGIDCAPAIMLSPLFDCGVPPYAICSPVSLPVQVSRIPF
jgi:hypothetical protein